MVTTEGITMIQPAIKVHGLTKHYADLVAVDDISFEVDRGEVFGFLGPNGAGKTTTIRMLVGLTRPSDGTAMVAGHSITDDIVEVKRRVGVVPEVSNLYDELSVWDNLLFMSRLYHVPRQARTSRIEEILQSFDLMSRSRMKFGKLSKGLKRRVVIAAALVHAPEVVFMDEPTVGLDVVSARTLREFIEKLGTEETTVFLTTHYIEEADRLCERIAIIVEGRIVVADTPEDIKKRIETQPIIRAELSHVPDRSLLRSLSDLGDLEHEGHIIRLRVENPGESLGLLINTLSSRGMSVEALETVRPTLEEAFVELTGMSPDRMQAEKGGVQRWD
ncbi:MAG: ATP-binding cassette domain-containing protein [Candidatus Thorarchaeota archaeon SMTZ1-83]